MQLENENTPRRQLEETIAALEAQRAILGDAVVETAVAPLKQKLKALGDDLKPAVHGLASERRIVTVLFCDMVGSTTLAEHLDPEAWTVIMNRVFRLLTEPVDHYGGTVARLMGDAILALFGAPEGHEDDPERAVLAGLRILEMTRAVKRQFHEESGMDIDFRVGINTGLAVVGEVGAEAHTEYTAMGDTVNVAARMEQTAVPGSVQISEATYNLVTHLFEVEPLGPISVKGRDMLVGAYKVLGRKAIKRRRRTAQEVQLIGRREELDLLWRILDRTREGQGQIALIIGEAGLGKSRLISALRAQWEAEPDPKHGLNLWTELSATSYSTGRPYGTFENQMRLIAGIAPTDSAALAREKLRQALANDPEHEFLQTVYERLLGIQNGQPAEISGEAFMHALYDSTVRAVRAETQGQPAVFVFDDWHWMDPASLGLVAHILELVYELPLLILLAMRPDQSAPAWDLRQKLPDQFGDRFTEITLTPLTGDDSIQLADALLAMDEVPDALQNLVLDRAEGNPFYIEELVCELRDRGLTDTALRPVQNDSGLGGNVDIPANLLSLVAARVDRLAKDVRLTLQLAAVIGRSFYVRVLRQISEAQAMLDSHLEQLEMADMIRLEPQSSELEYIFRHALTQEAVYSTLLLEQRRRIHEAVGQALEALFPDRKKEFAPILARHFDEARLLDKAGQYYFLAGEEAAMLHANEQAVDYFGRALAIAQEQEADTAMIIDLYGRLGRVLEHLHRYEEADRTFSELEKLGRERGDKSMILAGLISHMTLYANPTALFDFKKVKTLATQALSLAAEIGDRSAEARLYLELCTMYTFLGELNEAMVYGDRALKLARDLGDRRLLAQVLNDLSSHLYTSQGELKQAKMTQSEALQLWRDLGDKAMQTDSLSTLTEIYYYEGNFDEALASSASALKISRDIHNLWGQSYSQFMIGLVFWERGRPDLAIQTMEESIRMGELAGFLIPQIGTRADLAHLYACFGDSQTALEILPQAVEIATKTALFFKAYCIGIHAAIYLLKGNVDAAAAIIDALENPVPQEPDSVFFMQIYQVEIDINLHRGNSEQALVQTDKLLDYLETITGVPIFMQILVQKARVLRALNRKGEARAVLNEALALAETMRAQWTMWQIEAEFGYLAGNKGEARSHFQRAWTIVQSIAEYTPDHLRASFLNRPPLLAIRSSLEGV